MQGDGGQFVFHGAGQRPLARIGKQDRLAVGGKQRPQFKAGRDFGQAGETAAQVVAGDFAQIGDMAFAEMGELSGKPQMMWPDHCVQGTRDAEFHPGLHVDDVDYIQQKGQNPAVDSYSAFRDNDQAALTGLADYLRDKGVTEIDLCGLATDYCVKFSALDAADMLPGVKLRFIADASRGIAPEGVAAAIAEMRARGIEVINSDTALIS